VSVFEHPCFEHEHVAFFCDASAGLRMIVAVHTTGPFGTSGGGCRMWPYRSDDEALRDVLRLSRAMSFKLALLDMPAGGAKAVVIGDPREHKSEALLRAIGRAVERLAGRFVIAEDVGTTPADMRIVAKETKYVMGQRASTAGATAYGVFLGLREAVRRRLDKDVAAISVAIQGVGEVGFALGRELARAGARLIVTDVDRAKVERAVRELGARAVAPEAIFSADVDVLAPCALGSILDDETIPALRCSVVAGSANDQLAEDRHADALAARGVLFAPDFVVNAGGVLGAWQLGPAGGDEVDERARNEARRIVSVLGDALERADREGITPHAAAMRTARERIRAR
jgi:leucine dehydrogenase